jgi:hypothetical protein
MRQEREQWLIAGEKSHASDKISTAMNNYQAK